MNMEQDKGVHPGGVMTHSRTSRRSPLVQEVNRETIISHVSYEASCCSFAQLVFNLWHTSMVMAMAVDNSH